MYALLIGIHLLFLGVSHVIWYRILEWVFVLLSLFFLFYFSPLFFIDKDDHAQKGEPPRWVEEVRQFLRDFSPKRSLYIPLSLLSISLYGSLGFLLSPNIPFSTIYTLFTFGIFILLYAYTLLMPWKHDLYRQILSFQVITSMILLPSMIFFLEEGKLLSLFLFGGLVGTLIGYWALRKFFYFVSQIPLTLFLLTTIVSVWHLGDILFQLSFLTFLPVIIILSIFFFERVSLWWEFQDAEEWIKYFSLFLSLTTLPFLLYFSLDSLALSLSSLSILSFFYFSIHIRYCNYVTYMVALLSLFFLYGSLFSSLLTPLSLVSSLLFLFFLPFLIIGTSYFWEEKYPYDFTLLHYSSIVFSLVTWLYSLFFLSWGSLFFTFLFLSLFGIAFLFILSYFRFHTSHSYGR